MDLSVTGILISLAVLVILALRGWHIILLAPIATVIVCLFSGLDVLQSLYGPYMDGFISYAKRFYLVFLGASLFAKYMDDSGAAKKIAMAIMGRVGRDKPFPMLVAIWLITSILTYGGVNLWVVAFALIPIALPIFKEMNLPWHLCIAPFMLGLGTATMTMLPGTPAIQNIMPTKYLGTTAAAAPLIGVVSSIICSAIGLYYTKWALAKTQQRGETFSQPDNLMVGNTDSVDMPSLVVAVIPPAALLIILNVFKIDIVYSLLAGTALCIILFHKFIKSHLDTLNKGAVNTILPLVNTCADVGFGKVVAATTGFTTSVNALMNIPGHPLISMAIAINLLAGLTGSGSGGLGIALEVLIPKYQALGINPEIIHRIASMACGGLDTMPHNGAVITILAVFGLTHKTAYKHMFATCVVVPIITIIPAIAMAILFY
jgi:H+/gluconate symporter-like permease